MNSFMEGLRQTTKTSSRHACACLCQGIDGDVAVTYWVRSVDGFHTEKVASCHLRQYCQSFSVSDVDAFAAPLELYFLSYLH